MPELYLLDIEGTTSPIRFVYDVLFPYARKHMRDYITRHAQNSSLQQDLLLLAEERLQGLRRHRPHRRARRDQPGPEERGAQRGSLVRARSGEHVENG